MEGGIYYTYTEDNPVEHANSDDIQVEYADLYSNKAESSNDDGSDNDDTSTKDKSRSEKANATKDDDENVTVQSDANIRSGKRPSSRKVPSMYDENLYALPENALEEDPPSTTASQCDNTSSRGTSKSIEKQNKKGTWDTNQCRFLGLLAIFLIAAGVGAALYFTTNPAGKIKR